MIDIWVRMFVHLMQQQRNEFQLIEFHHSFRDKWYMTHSTLKKTCISRIPMNVLRKCIRFSYKTRYCLCRFKCVLWHIAVFIIWFCIWWKPIPVINAIAYRRKKYEHKPIVIQMQFTKNKKTKWRKNEFLIYSPEFNWDFCKLINVFKWKWNRLTKKSTVEHGAVFELTNTAYRIPSILNWL